MSIVTDKGIIPEQYDVRMIDNRDPGETWVWLDGTDDYVSIKPREIFGNMVENCYNEDVWFVFDQFTQYLTFIDKDDIKDDTDTDHIKGFHGWLSNMIAQSEADKIDSE